MHTNACIIIFLQFHQIGHHGTKSCRVKIQALFWMNEKSFGRNIEGLSSWESRIRTSWALKYRRLENWSIHPTAKVIQLRSSHTHGWSSSHLYLSELGFQGLESSGATYLRLSFARHRNTSSAPAFTLQLPLIHAPDAAISA